MAISATHKEITFGVGDVVRVHILLTDKPNEGASSEAGKGGRHQIFEGTVIGIRGRDVGRNIVVRRIGEAGIGIEQIFPLNSPLLEKVQVVREGKRGVRQAKIYYTRNKSKREIEKIYTRARRRSQAKVAAKTAKPNPTSRKAK